MKPKQDNDFKNSPAYPLFHEYYLIRIPASYAFEVQHELFGTPVYDNDDQEAMAAQEMVLQQHTIADMAELYHRGAHIILENPKDSTKIYERLKRYLDYMRDKVQGVNVGKVPVDDIRKLDEFAMSLYKVTRKYEQVDLRQSPMNAKLDSLFSSRFRHRAAYFEQEKEQAQSGKREHEKREHEPISELISEKMFERNLPGSNKREDES